MLPRLRSIIRRVAALGPRVAYVIAICLIGSLATRAAASTFLPERGIWWNSNEPGRGFFIDRNGSTVALAGFLYDNAGRAAWFIASGPLVDDTLTADMKTYGNGQTLTGLYRAPTVGTPLGTLTLHFTSPRDAILTWPGGTERITRYGIGPNGTVLPPSHPDGPATGIWWNAAQSGRGFTLEMQGENLLIGGYMYDNDTGGNPVWYISSAPYHRETNGIDSVISTFSGAWQQYANGQAMGVPFRPAQLVEPNVGSYTFRSSWVNGLGYLSLTLPDQTLLPLTKFFCDPAQVDGPRCPAPGISGPPAPVSLAVTNVIVTKVQAGDHGVAFMEEKLTSLLEPGPLRSLTLLDNDGAVSGRYAAPSGWALVDFAQHPSGEISAILTTATAVRLVRLDRSAAVIDEFDLTDAQAPGDPFYDQGGLRNDNSLQPVWTHDAARLAAIGENVAVALRTGRNAVVAYRFDYAAPAGYARAWRTLVEPGESMFGISITSGSFDTFGQLINFWQVHLDADAAGNVAVGVVGRAFSAPLFASHSDYFKESVTALNGVLVTRLAPDGRRLGSTLVDTVQTGELYGLRMSADDIALVGRVFSEKRDDGTGWNAYAAHVGRANGALSNYRVVDLDGGDVLFDIAPLGQGRFLVAGATGYSQNPTGASISEQAAPLLAILEADGSVKRRLDVAAGARQNQLRSLAARGGDWLVGGMVNGPGTHSGDGNPALITADGFVHELVIAEP